MLFKQLDSLADIAPASWDALWPSDYPFTRHAFLSALEASGCVGEHSGWIGQHLIALDEQQQLCFAMPLYLKQHSYGEYVFDWSWAKAYQRYALAYYPKLVNAIPFTPSCGPRWASNQEIKPADLQQQLMTLCQQLNASGVHSLFADVPSALNQNTQWQQRQGTQFQWFNRGYTCFDDFLNLMSSRKRKNIKKEREKIHDFDIRFTPASELDEHDWHEFYQLYRNTYLKRSGHAGYLTKAFFILLAKTMPSQVLLCQARLHGKVVAAAVYLADKTTLYGRYWGSLAEFDGLHFECCYYQGINYAIEHQLQRFCPGAQGEHKIQRGFEPVLTQSWHWLKQTEFHDAIHEFCQQERRDNQAYLQQCRQHLPFKTDLALMPADVLIQP